jgi:hypothetical protein
MSMMVEILGRFENLAFDAFRCAGIFAFRADEQVPSRRKAAKAFQLDCF